MAEEIIFTVNDTQETVSLFVDKGVAVSDTSKITTSRFEARCLGQAVNGRIDNYTSALENIALKESTASLLFDAKICGVGDEKLFNLLPFDLYKDFTVARNGTATYIGSDGFIKKALANVPRIDYTDSVSPALLVEPQATNLFTYSEYFTDSSWAKIRCSISENNTTSPDGTINADKILGTTDNNNHQCSENINATVSVPVVASVFIKKSDYDYIILKITDNTANVNGGLNTYQVSFNISNGTFNSALESGTPTDPFYKIEDYGSGWYRCSVGLTKKSDAVRTDLQIFLMDSNLNNINPTFIGDETSGTYVWGAQLETGTVASSYIPTEGTTVTRVADVVTVSPPTGTTSITETINGVNQTPITIIPTTYTIPIGNINKISMT